MHLKLGNSAGCDILGGEERPDGGGLEIVQVVRRMDPQGGVGGVALVLDAFFRARGVAGPAMTAESLGLRRGGPGRFSAAAEIVAFTVKATLEARRARRRGAVVVVHGDALGGDIYVDHGLHRALLARRPWLLLNPLHVFIAAREALRRSRWGRTRVVCLSQAGAAALLEASPRRRSPSVTILPNGVALERFRPSSRAAPSPDGARLVFIGREFGRKGLRHVLDALALLPAGVRLEVVGGRAREQAAARRRAERLGVGDRVHFHGVRRDVEAVLGESDLLVLPSVLEAFPLVVLEAMACGVPALISGVPAAPELIGDDEAGRVVAPQGAAVAAAVRALFADPDAFQALRRRAIARVQGFGWPEVASRYIALAEEVRRGRAAAA